MLQADSSHEGPVALLFSGGRDSSLAACLLAKNGASVHLLTTFNGAVVKGDISNYRYEELKTAFPQNIATRIIIPSYSLFRRVALADLERDFELYHTNLIPVGDAIASHTEAIIYCLQHSIPVIASGFTRYEADYPEQFPEAIQLLRDFLAEYGLRYLTPVFEYDHVDKVKFRLFDFGISTKSLEGTSLFADSYSIPTPETVCRYISAKFPICREYIAFKSGDNFDRTRPRSDAER